MYFFSRRVATRAEKMVSIALVAAMLTIRIIDSSLASGRQRLIRAELQNEYFSPN